MRRDADWTIYAEGETVRCPAVSRRDGQDRRAQARGTPDRRQGYGRRDGDQPTDTIGEAELHCGAVLTHAGQGTQISVRVLPAYRVPRLTANDGDTTEVRRCPGCRLTLELVSHHTNRTAA